MKKIIFIATVFLSLYSTSQIKPNLKASVKLFPMGDFVAQFSNIQGEALLKNDGKVYADKISVDMNTISSGLELRDQHAKEKYLLSNKFPQATLVNVSGENGKGTGKLKIKDIEKEVTGTYKIIANSKALEARFKISLADFKFDKISYKGIGLEDEIEITAIVPLKQDTAANKKPSEILKK